MLFYVDTRPINMLKIHAPTSNLSNPARGIHIMISQTLNILQNAMEILMGDLPQNRKRVMQ